MSDPVEPKDPLADYVKTTGKSDAAIGRLIGVSRWTISRGRSGKQPLQIADQIALEEFTGVSLAKWGEYYSKVLKGRAPASKKNGAASLVEDAA
jgi:hypothetical protein